MANDDLCFATLTETSARLRSRELSPVDLVRAQLARIDARNPALHAYLTVLAPSALEEARTAEQNYERSWDAWKAALPARMSVGAR